MCTLRAETLNSSSRETIMWENSVEILTRIRVPIKYQTLYAHLISVVINAEPIHYTEHSKLPEYAREPCDRVRSDRAWAGLIKVANI